MDKLGIEPTLLIAQLVNFSIILFVLSKLLYKPIMAMLEKRKKTIAEGVALTESLKVEEEKLSQKREKILAETRADAREIIEEAKKQAKDEVQTIIDTARREADEIIDKGKREVISEREAMQKSVEREAIELAEIMASKLLSQSVKSDMQHEIIKKQLKQISKLNVS